MSKITLNYNSIEELNAELAKHFNTDYEKAGVYLHEIPARDIAHVEQYLNGDSDDRSKITFLDGKTFHRIA